MVRAAAAPASTAATVPQSTKYDFPVIPSPGTRRIRRTGACLTARSAAATPMEEYRASMIATASPGSACEGFLSASITCGDRLESTYEPRMPFPDSAASATEVSTESLSPAMKMRYHPEHTVAARRRSTCAALSMASVRETPEAMVRHSTLPSVSTGWEAC